MEWHHPTSQKNKLKDIPSAEVMTTVFWEAQGVTWIGIMPHVQTSNSNLYIQNLKTLQKHIRRVQFYKNGAEILFQHENPQKHTSLKMRETITKLG
jgi:hypothetical protein